MHGPANKRQIETRIKPRIDHPTIHKIVLDLIDRKMVELDHHEKSQSVKFYRPAKHGVLSLIWDEAYLGDQDELVRQLAKKYTDMFEVFRLWPAIIEAGLEQMALEVLSLACQRVLGNAMDYSQSPPKPVEPHDPTSTFLDPFRLGTFVGTIQTRELWLKAVSQNLTLREATARVLRQKTIRDLQAVNEVLEYLAEEKLKVGATIDEVQEQGEVIQELRLAVRMLQDASGLKVTFSKKSGDQKA
jgi:hypothetical protein